MLSAVERERERERTRTVWINEEAKSYRAEVSLRQVPRRHGIG